MLKEAVQVLDDPRIIEGNPDLKAQIIWELLPFLVLTNAAPKSVELHMTTSVAETTLLSKHPLTQDWTKGKFYQQEKRIFILNAAFIFSCS